MDTVHPRHIESDEFRYMAAKSLDGFLAVDVTGYILEANDSYCCLMGYSREELLKRHISEIDAVESTEDVSKRAEELINRGGLRFQTRHIHKNGSIIDVEVSSTYSPKRRQLGYEIAGCPGLGRRSRQEPEKGRFLQIHRAGQTANSSDQSQASHPSRIYRPA